MKKEGPINTEANKLFNSSIENDSTSLTEVFANIFLRSYPVSYDEYRTPSEFEKYQVEDAKKGAKMFKRQVLGFCGNETILKSKDLEGVLIKMNAMNEVDADRILKMFDGEEIEYGTNLSNEPVFIKFEKVHNQRQTCAYRISKIVRVRENSSEMHDYH